MIIKAIGSDGTFKHDDSGYVIMVDQSTSLCVVVIVMISSGVYQGGKAKKQDILALQQEKDDLSGQHFPCCPITRTTTTGADIGWSW